METFNELIAKTLVLKNKVEKAIENGKKTRLEKRTSGFYKQRLMDLRKLWKDFVDADMQLKKFILLSKEECVHAYISEEQFDAIEVKYSEYVGELQDGLDKFTETPSSPTVNPQTGKVSMQLQDTQEIVPNVYPQLPKINLPRFDGDYNAWRSFHDLFVSLVHDNPYIQPVQKLHYLKTCLVGEAERVLRHTPITNEDYEVAWQKLKTRYENKRTLVNHQLRVLINQPKLSSENCKGLKGLVDTTEECLQQLKALEVDASSWDTLLIYLIVQKLPFVTLRLWEEEQKDSQKLPEYKTFINFLRSRIRVLESISNSIATKSTTNSFSNSKHDPNSIKRETTQVYHVTTNANCPACQRKHYVGGCKAFLKLNVLSRRKLIKDAGKCFNCFSGKHVNGNCSSKYRCHKCQGLHHTTLHFSEASSKKHSKGASSIESLKPDECKPSSPAEGENVNMSTSSQDIHTNSSNQTQSFLATERYNTLLSTALVVAKGHNGHLVPLRCLLDTGSQTSFLTENAYRKLKLSGTQTSVPISGLNKNQTAIVNKQVRLQLRSTKSHTPTVEVNMLVLKQITDLLPTKELINKNWEHLQGLELADPTFWKPGPIDALLGADVYAQVLLEGLRKGPENAPIAINTIFGWIILGNISTSTDVLVKSFTTTVNPVMNLNEQLPRFRESQEFSEDNLLKPENEKCQQKYRNTNSRLSNGKYQIKVPFTSKNAPALGDSKGMVLKRFKQTNLARSPQSKEETTKHRASEKIPKEFKINEHSVSSLSFLKPSNTIEDIKMKINNDIQRFITREGEDLYIQKDVLSRIDFERIRNSKRKQFTVNLHNQYQVKVNVNKAGKIVFHHYHHRGASKARKKLVELNRSTGGSMLDQPTEIQI